MTLSNEMNRLANIDAMKTTFSTTNESTSAITGGLRSIGLLNDDATRVLSIVSGSMQLMTGMAGLATVAKAMQERKRAEETAKSAALVTMNAAIGPVGWGNIALATGVMAVTSVAMYAMVTEIRLGDFDLSSPAGRTGAIQAVQEVA